MPWKNGGGITHEIALTEGPNGFAWRLSIAEVASSGPFSKFDGKERILTVIEGNGIDLVSSDQKLSARKIHPVAFSGETDIDGQLIDGPIRDFNLIFDPGTVAATVKIVENSETPIPLNQNQNVAVHAVEGAATISGEKIAQSDTLIASGDELSSAFVRSEGWAIIVVLSSIS